MSWLTILALVIGIFGPLPALWIGIRAARKPLFTQYSGGLDEPNANMARAVLAFFWSFILFCALTFPSLDYLHSWWEHALYTTPAPHVRPGTKP